VSYQSFDQSNYVLKCKLLICYSINLKWINTDIILLSTGKRWNLIKIAATNLVFVNIKKLERS
jgi:hypothetical protein